MKINDTAFLCGYFSNKSSEMLDPIAFQGDFWESHPYTNEEVISAKDFYYPEFADFIMTEVHAYSHSYDKDVHLTMRDGRIHKVHLEENKSAEKNAGRKGI